MRRFKIAVVLMLLAATSLAQVAAEKPLKLDQVLDRVIAQENALVDSLHDYTPLAETYIQELRTDPELGLVPQTDHYFLSKAGFNGWVYERPFDNKKKGVVHRLDKFKGILSNPFTMKYKGVGFLQGALLDPSGFDLRNYQVEFVRREFLGDVRCLIFDVTPKQGTGRGRFQGRIWVEDQDYHIVRLSGVRINEPWFQYYFHFDSWRVNMGPGLWLPAYIYSEESDRQYSLVRHARLKAQTRLWGYDLKNPNRQDELTTVIVDAPTAVNDRSETSQDRSPIQAYRAWQRQSEDNVLEKLERAGLLAPHGDVEKVLETVVTNLEVTNNLDIQPEVRCRVLLTAPLESFTIGHTIVLSRGLLDTLPDEASLAMVLAHELGHVKLGHQLDTQWAFNDRMIFSDEDAFRRLTFRRDPAEEEAADKTALELLKNSPYKDKLSEGGLFLRALAARSKDLPNLVSAHLGNRIAMGDQVLRMQELANSAPELKMSQVDQIAALPLGARLKVDPWSDRVELLKAKPMAPTSAREKMPFEVTPFLPYLTRKPVGSAPASTQTAAVPKSDATKAELVEGKQ